jgi:hypothetical protein
MEVLKLKYKENWAETQDKFKQWWEGKNTGRPLMKVVAKRKSPVGELENDVLALSPEQYYMDVEMNVRKYRNYCKSHKFLAEAFPNLGMDIGPGSMALYLGAEPEFAWDTVWYKECIHDWSNWGNFRFDPNNTWWKKHIEMIRRAVALSAKDFSVTIPDIIENVDIISAMRGPQNLLFDIMDEPEMIKDYVNQIDDLYFNYYNSMYDLVKEDDGSSSYTCFQIWGPGRTAKIQCDISALLSPAQFIEFAQPSLRKQCQKLDYSLYHLDGPDAIKHVDAIMEIKELDALQWTCGAGQPDGGCERWYPIYDKVRAAGKSLWIQLYDGDVKEWIASSEKLIKRYGTEGLFLLFPDMEEDTAEQLLQQAEKNWK